jgi:hypothetical protein
MSRKHATDLETLLNEGLRGLESVRPGFKFEVNTESWDIHPVRSNITLGDL